MNLKKYLKWTGALSAVVFMAALAFVPSSLAGQDAKGFVQRFDQDQDGLVSREEFDGPPACFDCFDRNGDGYIAAQESPGRGRHRRKAGWFLKGMDSDADGRISAEEYRVFTQDRFDRLDRNGDGYIDAAEMPSWTRGGRDCRFNPKSDESE